MNKNLAISLARAKNSGIREAAEAALKEQEKT